MAKYVIYDLEATQNTGKVQSEIIEVGAVMLDENLKQIGTFQSFIKPKMNSELTGFIKKLTGITQNNIDNARSFGDVVEEFKEWLGNEDYFLCAWGKDDAVLFHRDCTLNEIDTSWIKNHNNIQNRYSEVNNLEKGQVVSLSNAIEQLNIKKDINGHRALNDAIYTAQIFEFIFDKIELYINNGPDMDQIEKNKKKNQKRRKRRNRMKNALAKANIAQNNGFSGFSIRDILGDKLSKITKIEKEG